MPWTVKISNNLVLRLGNSATCVYLIQTIRVQNVPFQYFVTFLNACKFSEDFMRCDRLFQTLGPKAG